MDENFNELLKEAFTNAKQKAEILSKSRWIFDKWCKKD